MDAAARLVVVTGPPGAGKTTLLAALRERGWAVGGDAARDLVRADPRVREDDEAFRRAILAHEVGAYDAAARGTTYFDRGIPDAVAGWVDVPPDVDAVVRAHPYDAVYVLPPWREIYVTDAERTHTFDHAERVYAAILETYTRYNYDVALLPRATVEERVALVEAASSRRRSRSGKGTTRRWGTGTSRP
jgi:predicted ATPase